MNWLSWVLIIILAIALFGSLAWSYWGPNSTASAQRRFDAAKEQRDKAMKAAQDRIRAEEAKARQQTT